MAVKEEPSGKVRKSKETEKKAEASESSERQLKIRLMRSVIGRPRKQREVVKGLGLRKTNSEVIREDRPEIRGMIRKISHLLNVEELEKK
jgi:large subunit ribosomal protein L30